MNHTVQIADHQPIDTNEEKQGVQDHNMLHHSFNFKKIITAINSLLIKYSVFLSQGNIKYLRHNGKTMRIVES